MQATLDFLGRHGYWVLFATVLAEQLGIPIPAVPVLIAVGALAGLGKLSFAVCLALAVLACLLSDTFWYWLGRKKGLSILRLMCKISLEPDTCVSIAQDWFRRRGSSALLIAKFMPGFSTVAPPMAGVNGMSLSKFIFFDGVGSMIWAGASMIAGWAFRNQLEQLMESMHRLGSWFGGMLVGVLALYILFKWFQRHRLINQFLMARISPDELQERKQSGEFIAVIDLRGELEMRDTGLRIPGATWFRMSDIDSRMDEIPRGGDIVLYCS